MEVVIPLRVVIIGSGVIGVTTACLLRKVGYEVTVVERNDGPGLETTYANGALLTPSMSDPWNAPESWRVLLASLGRSDSAMQLRVSAIPSLATWGVTFIRNSTVAAFERNTAHNLRLALHSLDEMSMLREETRIEYGRSTTGTLRVFKDSAAMDKATLAASRLTAEGLTFRALSRIETVELEPSLEPIATQLTGALHYQKDETGNAYRFCSELTSYAQDQGVQFRFGTVASALHVSAGRLSAVTGNNERISGDRFVVAAGSYSTPLLKSAGIRLPVRPVKGYSVTFGGHCGTRDLRIPIVDDQLHAVVLPIDGGIRVAGTAEFAGYDRTLEPSRVETLLRLLQKVLPRGQFDLTTARPWCGLRAMSADGVPIIGSTSVPNLWVNTGHGHLGWTMAAGSARLLVDLMCGNTPAVEPRPYSPSRFI